MAFRRVSYLVSSCDGCGLAWSFFDPACAEGIPPHFASKTAALEQLPADHGWQVCSRRLGRPLMACRFCATALLTTISLQFTVPSGALPEPPATAAALLNAGQQAVAIVMAELNRIAGPVLGAGDMSLAAEGSW